jgi:hypothetical protein
MRLIDADALVKHIKDLPTWWADDGGVYPGGSMKYPDGMYYPEDIISSIDNAPTVPAVEVVHAHWVYDGDEVDGNIQAHCSNCFAGDVHATWKKNNIPYCWNCGARMDGGNEDGPAQI